MKKEDLIISYLQDMNQGLEELRHDVTELKCDVSGLKCDVSSLKEDVSGLKEDVFSLKQEIADLRQEMNGKIDMLDQKMDSVEMALDTEIDSVYHIALENKRNIEILLIPFNDRNAHMNEEVARIPKLNERVDRVETVVGRHSKEIRKLQSTLA